MDVVAKADRLARAGREIYHLEVGQPQSSAPQPAIRVAQEQLTVRSSSQGHVDQVYVKSLDEVREGQPLAQLSNEALSTHADQLRAELKQLQDVALTAESSGRGSAALDSVDFAGELDTARSQKERMSERLRQMQQT